MRIILAAIAALFMAVAPALADWPGDRNNGGGNDPPHQTPAQPERPNK
jgi:hypothetical protein